MSLNIPKFLLFLFSQSVSKGVVSCFRSRKSQILAIALIAFWLSLILKLLGKKKLHDKRWEWQKCGDIKDKQTHTSQLKGRAGHEQKMAW